MSVAEQVQQIFDNMPGQLNLEKAAGVDVTVQISLTGDGGSDRTVRIADGKCNVTDGPADSPDMTLTMAASDYVAMINGELNAMNAFMQGKIKLQGDMGLAMKFQGLFS